MIPPFNEEGYLPPGVHLATLEEVAERFGTGSEDREAQIDALRRAVKLAKRIGVKRFIVNGSFVTAKQHPIDVDCVALADQLTGSRDERELEEGIPYVSVYLTVQPVFERFVRNFFASDDVHVPKGMVELLW
ncbi:MAG: hypothetical protein HY000_34415 [Planctomycetes bacterium]|nr:hypothetical protein [Planctomycetota bacterium]